MIYSAITTTITAIVMFAMFAAAIIDH